MVFLKCACFSVCVCVCARRETSWFFFLISAICLCVGDSQTSVKRLIVVIPQQVSISEQSPFFHSAGNLPPHNIVACVPVLPHTYSQEQIWFHHNWLTKAIVAIQHQSNKCNKLMHGGSSLTHAACRRPRMNKQERPSPSLIKPVSSRGSDKFNSVPG